MTVISNVSNIYEFNGTILDIQTGGLLNAGLINTTDGPVTGTFEDNNGQLTLDDNSLATTFGLTGNPQESATYIGSGTMQTATLLGIPLLSVPVSVFQIGTQIYLYAPNGLPLLSGLLIDFDIDVNVPLNLPGSPNGQVDGLDTAEVMNVGYTDLQNEAVSSGNDIVFGHGGNDQINAGAGNDHLFGGIGNDTVNGEAGNDTIEGDDGADVLNGGDGIDTLSYASSGAAVTVRLFNNTAAGGSAAGDVISNFENVTGSAFNDALWGDGAANVIRGGDGNDTIEGGAGADTLDGGAGIDTLSYGASTQGVTVRLFNNTATGGVANGDVISGFENIVGSGGQDFLSGNAGANVIHGGAGNDTIDGGNGADTLVGGAGVDTLSYSGHIDAVNVRLWNNSASGGVATGDVISGFENLIGGQSSDFLGGNAGINVLDGRQGNDTLVGGGDADYFDFRPDFDNDRINDFEVGVDTIRIYGHEAADISFSSFAAGTRINVGTTGDSIFVVGVSAAQLSTFADIEFL